MANHHHFTRAFEELFEQDKMLTGFQMYAFLLTATNEGIIQKDLEHKIGTSSAVASRTIAKLTKFGYDGRPGLDLIETTQDPSDRRFRIVTLTPKGRSLIQRMRDIMGDKNGNTKREKVAG